MVGEIKIGVPVGTFSRGALIHRMMPQTSGLFVIFIECATDKACFWQNCEFSERDNLQDLTDDKLYDYVECKLTAAFTHVEHMLNNPLSDVPMRSLKAIEDSRGRFNEAIEANPSWPTEESNFSFLAPILREQFARFAEAYGFNVA